MRISDWSSDVCSSDLPCAAAEDQLRSVFVIGVDQLIHLPPTGIQKKLISFRQALHLFKAMHLVHVIKPFAAETDREIKIKFSNRGIIVIQVNSNGNPVSLAGKTHGLRTRFLFRVIKITERIKQAYGHLNESVLILLINQHERKSVVLGTRETVR